MLLTKSDGLTGCILTKSTPSLSSLRVQINCLINFDENKMAIIKNQITDLSQSVILYEPLARSTTCAASMRCGTVSLPLTL
jgi:hypothetical protein